MVSLLKLKSLSMLHLIFLKNLHLKLAFLYFFT